MSAVPQGDRTPDGLIENKAGPERSVRSAPTTALEAVPAEARPVSKVTLRIDRDRSDPEQLFAAATQLILDAIDVDPTYRLRVSRRNERRDALPDVALGEHAGSRSVCSTEVAGVAESYQNEFEVVTATSPQAPDPLQCHDLVLIETSFRRDDEVILMDPLIS